MNWPATLVISFFVFFSSMFGTRFLITFLSRAGAMDCPNERSSHKRPVPRGAGIAVISAFALGCFAAEFFLGPLEKSFLLIAGLALLLAGVSWLDDLNGLNPALRLFVQAILVVAGLILAPLPEPLFEGFLSPKLEFLLIAVAWIWFINLFNFMDGIDGLAGIETVAIGFGLFIINRKLAYGEHYVILGLVLAAAGLGFLRWNWHPAKIFLGDVGSVSIGFVTGWLLLQLAANGAWVAALILPLYFVADATITLFRRAIRGDRIWEPHREHFYQRAIASGLRHDQVSWIIAIANMFLIMLAIVATRGLSEPALLGAIGAIIVLMFLLVKGGPTN